MAHLAKADEVGRFVRPTGCAWQDVVHMGAIGLQVSAALDAVVTISTQHLVPDFFPPRRQVTLGRSVSFLLRILRCKHNACGYPKAASARPVLQMKAIIDLYLSAPDVVARNPIWRLEPTAKRSSAPARKSNFMIALSAWLVAWRERMVVHAPQPARRPRPADRRGFGS
jgi:hypothetical protein